MPKIIKEIHNCMGCEHYRYSHEEHHSMFDDYDVLNVYCSLTKNPEKELPLSASEFRLVASMDGHRKFETPDWCPILIK